MYSDFELYEFNLIYTAQNVKEGTEFFTHSNELKLPENPTIKRKSTNIEIIKNNFQKLDTSSVLEHVHM